MSLQQKMYIQARKRRVERELSGYGDPFRQNSAIANDWMAELTMLFSRASREAEKQIQLPLTETQKWEPLHHAPKLQFLAPNISISPGEKITGTILFDLSMKIPETQQQETIYFATWLDKHFQEAMDLLRKSILQTAVIAGEEAKEMTYRARLAIRSLRIGFRL